MCRQKTKIELTPDLRFVVTTPPTLYDMLVSMSGCMSKKKYEKENDGRVRIVSKRKK